MSAGVLEVQIEIEVEDPAWAAALPEAAAMAEAAARAALDGHDLGPAAALTVLLADDATVHALNTRFRDKDRPTNVLSFPAAASAAPHIGDIALAYGVCAAEAAAQGKPLAHHLQHLTVHGVLHLLGYDHDTDAEAEDMEGTERAVLARLGVPDPYALIDPGASEANA